MYRYLLLILVPCFLLTACLNPEPVVLQKVESVKFNRIDSDGLDVTMVLRINNPNAYAIKISNIDLDLHVSGIPVGRVLITEKIKVPAKSVSNQSLNFTTSLKSAGLAAVPALIGLLSKKEVQVSAEGEITAGTFIFNKTFKVNFSEAVKL